MRSSDDTFDDSTRGTIIEGAVCWELLDEISYFIRYNLSKLQYTYSNDTALILYCLCNDFLEASQNTMKNVFHERINSIIFSTASEIVHASTPLKGQSKHNTK